MTSLNFADPPEELTDSTQASVVVVPIPLEKTVTYQRGTHNGPVAILKASQQLEMFDCAINYQTARVGIHTAPAIDCRVSLKECVNQIKSKALHWFEKKKFPVFLGGEHSISVGIFQAIKEFFGEVTIIQIDAHADLRHSYHGSTLNHACVMSRARECDHKLVQVGIRALSEKEYQLTQSDPEITTFFDHDKSWRADNFKNILETITGPAYITIDVDGLDPSIMPATGTPVPGGLDWHETTSLLEGCFKKVNIIGADINELSPMKMHRSCDFLCAQLAYRLMGLKAKQENWPLIGEPLKEED